MNQAIEAAEGGWRTIDSAPKDGKMILAFATTRKGKPWSKVMVGKLNSNGRFVSFPGTWTFTVTHWQPLPQPPGGD